MRDGAGRSRRGSRGAAADPGPDRLPRPSVRRLFIDTVTHGFVGYLVGRAAFERAAGKRALAAATFGGLLPDADHLYELGGTASYILAHRGWTHGLLAVAGWGLAAAWIFGRGRPRERALVGLAGASGLLAHTLTDLLNAFGAMPLAPFSGRRFALDWVYIIDPVLFGLLLATIGATWIRRPQAAAIARLGLGLAILYVGLCGVHHAVALDRVRALAGERLGAARLRTVAAFPMYPTAFHWRGLIDGGDEVHEVRLRLAGGDPEWLEPWPAARLVDSRVPRTREKEAFDRLARFPAAFVREGPDGTAAIRFSDRQFQHVPGRSIYELTMVLDRDGRVLSQTFSDAHVAARLALFVLIYLLAVLAARRWLREEDRAAGDCQTPGG